MFILFSYINIYIYLIMVAKKEKAVHAFAIK